MIINPILTALSSRRCATWFQTSSESRITEVFDDEGDRTQLEATRSLEDLEECSNSGDSVMDKEGQKFVRRWHIIWEENNKAAPRSVDGPSHNR